MKKILLILAGSAAFFSPIQLMIIILMGIILIDTIVKLITIRKVARDSNRKYRDVFKSRILRKGFLFKSLGYLFLVGAVFPLDYFSLTPFFNGAIAYFGYDIQIPSTAIFTNGLLILFSLMEISSINENWFDLTGNNILGKASRMVKKIRGVIQDSTEFIDETKK